MAVRLSAYCALATWWLTWPWVTDECELAVRCLTVTRRLRINAGFPLVAYGLIPSWRRVIHPYSH